MSYRPPIARLQLASATLGVLIFDALAVVLIVHAVSGCASLAPASTKLEFEHVSHPLAGWPVGARDQEDALTQANGLLVWRAERAYVEAGLGYNLRGRDGGGIYGPTLTGTVRAGMEIPLR